MRFLRPCGLLILCLALTANSPRADEPGATTNGADASAPAVSLLPLNDNTAPPYMAIYRSGVAGVRKGFYDAYGPWLNRTVYWGEDFIPTEYWSKIEGEEWELGTWAPWVNKLPGRRYLLSMPVLVSGGDKPGAVVPMPKGGVPASLEEGAKGDYNIHYQHLAENLVKHKLGNTLIRVGWEFNGGWYLWRTLTPEKAAAFAAYFRQIVTTMRAVPGADKIQFIWNPNMQPGWPYDPEKAWPGDDVVDYVGIDVYDQSFAKDTYPFPPNATPDEILARQKLVWDTVINSEKAYGLPYWVKFAAAHHKPLVIPEWGIYDRPDKHGGGDDPYFVQQMFNFIYNPANNVYFECYFDVHAGDGNHQLCPDPEGKFPQSSFPQSAALYKKLFSLPGGAPAAPSAPAATGTP